MSNRGNKQSTKRPIATKGRAEIFEVGPRDGLQAEKTILTIDQRVALISKLVLSGIQNIEIGSFIKPGLIPQLDQSELVAKAINKRFPLNKRNCLFWAFIPNEHGLENGIRAEINGASFFTATSNTFAKKNVNKGLDELLKNLPSLIKLAHKSKLKTRVYLSTLTHCPYEGAISAKTVGRLVDLLVDFGASEIALSDTTGHTHPKALRKVFDLLLKKHPPKKFALHMHDTWGLALSNVLVGLDYGIRRFDSSIAGAGGCPYAPGATGNLATEDLANMLTGMGHLKNIDTKNLLEAGTFLEQCLSKKMPSKTLQALNSQINTRQS